MVDKPHADEYTDIVDRKYWKFLQWKVVIPMQR